MNVKECPHGREHQAHCPQCAGDAKAAGGSELASWNAARIELNCDQRFPRRYVAAAATHPEVAHWVNAYVHAPTDSPSLLIAGPVGVGKTWQAYGALRAAASRTGTINWNASTYADAIAAIRPSGSSDPEATMRNYRTADLLLLDDLGTAKNSEWVEETTYRLLNGRYEGMLPSIFTTNVPLADLRDVLGDRLASRLVEICMIIAMTGVDRRRSRQHTT